MNYDIIFYHSGRTAEAEKLLASRLTKIGLERSGTLAATEPSELPEMLRTALCRCELVFIIGGLDGSRNSTDTILSQILTSTRGVMSSERLIDGEDNSSYLIRSGRQTIVLLPDDTDVIGSMLDKRLLNELKEFYSLTDREDDKLPIEQIAKQLDKQLASMPRRAVPFTAPADLSYDGRDRRMMLIAAVIGAAAVVQAVLAVIFLTV